MPIIIIGAGPAGLSCAYHILKENPKAKIIILEKDNEVGGISKTIKYHKNYMDIQIDLIGIERVDTGDLHNVTLKEYNPDADCAAAEAPDLASCVLGAGNFIICMAKEPHKPNIAVTEDTFLKKAVCKVRI